MKKLGLFILLLTAAVGVSIAAGIGNRKADTPSPTVAGETQGAGQRPATPNLPVAEQGGEVGMPAIEKAAKANKYLFVFFWKEDDEQTAAMRKIFAEALAKVSDRAEAVSVCVTTPAEKGIVDKFQLDRAPMPLVLALAPNGAITGGFPKKFEEKTLLDAFASPCTERCMKALQENKLVFVCVQNEKTKSNEAAMQGVRDFTADSKYSKATEIVMLNPGDSKEAAFLGDLKIDPKTTEAVTAFMAPPGAVVAELTGETKKDDLVAALQKASSGCCPGGSCGPGGCPPKN